jgi:hypothetical protein
MGLPPVSQSPAYFTKQFVALLVALNRVWFQIGMYDIPVKSENEIPGCCSSKKKNTNEVAGRGGL